MGSQGGADPAASAVIAVLLTLMFYQVGFAQYYMVLFMLATYWLLGLRGVSSEAIPLCIALGCYFGWLALFDVLLSLPGDRLPGDARVDWAADVPAGLLAAGEPRPIAVG